MSLEAIAGRDFAERIRALREVDSVVDLARGWLQLNIILVLGGRGAVTVDELVSLLGQPRKAILDSLRKLRLKGLVEESAGRIALSERGLRVYSLLAGALSAERQQGSGVGGDGGSVRVVGSIYEELSRMIRYLYLYEAIVALGSSPRLELPLDVLAQILRVSPRQLDDYLSVYVEEGVFERFTREEGLGPFRRIRVYYRLGSVGVKVLRRLPEYVRARSSPATRLLVTLTRALHPRLVLKRVTLVISVGSSIAMSLAVALEDVGQLVLAGWIVLVSFLALLVAKSY